MSEILTTSVAELKQLTNKDMFIGTLSIEQIVKIVKFTNRNVLDADPFDLSIDLEAEREKQYYQRVKQSERAYNIKMFFLKHLYRSYNYEERQVSPLAAFPSSILLACYSYPDKISRAEYENIVKQENVSDFCFIDNDKTLLIPEEDQLLIVDGQHRVAGLETLLKEVKAKKIEVSKADQDDYFIKHLPPFDFMEKRLSEFQFLVTFLINFDRFEQAELFAQINFSQKPVSKSYYYDIYGSIQGRSLERLLHDLTAYLNFNPSSPLKGKIKMLGSGPGYISQAFMVETLLPLFKKGIFTDILNNYLENGNEYKKLPSFLNQYFTAFFKSFTNFMPVEGDIYKDVLLKTTGMAAIINLMPYINSRVKGITGVEPLNLSAPDLIKVLTEVLSKIALNGDEYFSRDSIFAKSAGRGLQNKLFNKILNDLMV